jgi:uncharacterized protein (DUF4415 family)
VKRKSDVFDEPIDDEDNPEWTEADFARAVGPEALSEAELAAFPRTLRRVRGLQKAPTKRLVSLRLDQAVLDYFKAGGPGWQSRINETLQRVIGESRPDR